MVQDGGLIEDSGTLSETIFWWKMLSTHRSIIPWGSVGVAYRHEANHGFSISGGAILSLDSAT